MIYTMIYIGGIYGEFQSMKQSLAGMKSGLQDIWDLGAGGFVSKTKVMAKYGNSVKDKVSKFWTKDSNKDKGL